MELFGKSGTSLLPMLADMGELQAEFRKKGLGMSAEDVAAAEAYGDTLELAPEELPGDRGGCGRRGSADAQAVC